MTSPKEIMEKQRQIMEATAENCSLATEKIFTYIEDPKERAEHVTVLRHLALQHAILKRDFDMECKALNHVSKKLNEIPQLDVQKEYETLLKEYKGPRMNPEQIRSTSSICQELEKTITRCQSGMKEK